MTQKLELNSMHVLCRNTKRHGTLKMNDFQLGCFTNWCSRTL